MPEEGRYVLTDPLGTPLVVAGPDGQVQNAYRYDEFGLSEYRREEAPLPFGFTGCLADRVDGLYYANAREYHAGSGKFLTKDLNHYMDFKDPGTLNLYQYAKGNPLKYVDPSGHESINEDYGYLFHTMNMAVCGSFTNDFTWAGLGIQLALGFLGVDIICDARDFAADVTVNRDLTSLSWWGMMALDIIALVPVIGDVKYLDDAAYGVKMLFKNGDELVDGSRKFIKASDNLRDLSRTGGNALDGLNDMAGTALKNADMLDNARHADDVVDAASDAGKRLEDVAGGNIKSKSRPSNPYNVNAKPSGTTTKITDKMDDATKRSLIRENEAAETIAQNGYNIEQNPILKETTRNPDYRIEGEIFDCYAPAENTKVRNIASTIQEKVIEKEQTNRVVLNLEDWNGNIDDLVNQLNEFPIEGLEEVLVVQNGKVISIYP